MDKYILKDMTSEQINIVNLLKNYNVKVEAVAGSGKTTTILQIAKEYSEKKILILTYNRKLMDETNKKIDDLGLNNVKAYTLHSFAQVFFSVISRTDEGIIKIVKDNKTNTREIDFDYIIVDEAQDITELFLILSI